MSSQGRTTPVLRAEGLTVRFGEKRVLADISMEIPPGKVVALIGPAKCGKTTLLRSFSRLNEIVLGAHTTGTVHLRGSSIYAATVDAAEIRRRVGMVFRAAAPFPKSVLDNVVFGLRAKGTGGDLHVLAEEALAAVGMWSRGSDVLEAQALDLSPGQQRRVCIARTVALKPDVILIDDPTAGLDAEAAAGIEAVIHSLRRDHAIVIATSDPAQAGRLSDLTAYLDAGELVEHGATRELFTNPAKRRTEWYLTGRLPPAKRRP